MMADARGYLQIEGWVMNGFNRYMIDPAGDTVRLPLLVLYVDQFWTQGGTPLTLPSQPISVEFTEALAKTKTVWSLGQRVRLSGQVAAIHVTRASQQRIVQQVRQRIATLDRNQLKKFWTGMLKRDEKLAKVKNLRNQYLAGKIGLNTLQNEENRIFTHERHVWLEELAVVHDKQLAMRRRAAKDLLAHSKTAYILKDPTHIMHTVSGRSHTEWRTRPSRSPRGGVQKIFVATALDPRVERKMIKNQYQRAELLVPLENFREYWLRVGRPVALLPEAPSSLEEKQQEWLQYEASKTTNV